MSNRTMERRVLAVAAVIIAFGIHYSQIQNQPEAVFSGLFLVAAVAFVTFEYYRSSDTKDIKATVAAIRMDQTQGKPPEERDEWVTEKKERVPVRGEDAGATEE